MPISQPLGKPATSPISPSRFRNPSAMLEKHLSQAIQEFLRIDDWRVFRQESLRNTIQGRYAGELGMPDLLALRYYHAEDDALGQAYGADALWIEVKRKGQKPKPHQLEWHAKERALGAEVVVVDDYSEFRSWYFLSGLNRRIKA